MCGIAGFLSLSGRVLGPADATVLDAMCRAIVHRGPDEQGTALIGPAALGARRLAIVDVATSHQPATGESGRTHLVFNGEYYSFGAMRRELIDRGVPLKTQGDTECVVQGYERWGLDGLLQRMDGMFAFALYDERDSSLVIARDRLGKKPLHWAKFGDVVIFGSELKSLIAHPAFERRVDDSALARFLAFEYVPGDRSVWSGVHKVAPGSSVRFTADGRVQPRTYWFLRWGGTEEQPGPQAGAKASEWAARLSKEVEGAVERRLVSEVPLGALLSGGVDSSAVAAMVARHRPGVRTFSVGFDERSFDESQWARRAAAHIGSVHQESRFDLPALHEAIEALPSWMDEPFADPSLLPTWHLARSVRRSGVTVVLSGDGADELFAGYPTYFAHRIAAVLNLLPKRALGALSAALSRWPPSFENLSVDYRLRRLLAGAMATGAARHLSFLGGWEPGEIAAVLATGSSVEPYAEAESLLASSLAPRPLDRWLDLDQRSYLVDDILVKVDRASMASSVEVRCPLLDHRVVELAAALPPQWKLRGSEGKWLWKEAARPWLPQGLVDRPKKGFGIPVALWLQGPLRAWMEDLLLGPRRSSRFDDAVVRRFVDEHQRGVVDHRKRLWPLLMWSLWERSAFGPG